MGFMDNDDKKQQLARWLTDKFLEWQTKQGEPRDWRDFAAYLDVGEGALGTWRNKRSLPDTDGIIQIAKRYPEVWGILKIEPPPPTLSDRIFGRVASSWNQLTLDQQREVEDFFSTITAEELILFLRDACRMRRHGKRGGGDAPTLSRQSSDQDQKGRSTKGHMRISG